VEGAAADEEDVGVYLQELLLGCLRRPWAVRWPRALDDLEQGLLHAIAGDSRVMEGFSAAGDIVDLVDVDDARWAPRCRGRRLQQVDDDGSRRPRRRSAS
jgi:hypothetical protein